MDIMKILSPPTPCRGPIPGGMVVGRKVRLRGNTPAEAKGFGMGLCGKEDYNNVVLEYLMAFRFEDRKAAVNNFVSGKAGKREIWDDMMLEPGYPLEVLVDCEAETFKVSINGDDFCEFSHRIAFQLITHVIVIGDVIVELLSFEGPNIPHTEQMIVPARRYTTQYGGVNYYTPGYGYAYGPPLANVYRPPRYGYAAPTPPPKRGCRRGTKTPKRPQSSRGPQIPIFGRSNRNRSVMGGAAGGAAGGAVGGAAGGSAGGAAGGAPTGAATEARTSSRRKTEDNEDNEDRVDNVGDDEGPSDNTAEDGDGDDDTGVDNKAVDGDVDDVDDVGENYGGWGNNDDSPFSGYNTNNTNDDNSPLSGFSTYDDYGGNDSGGSGGTGGFWGDLFGGGSGSGWDDDSGGGGGWFDSGGDDDW